MPLKDDLDGFLEPLLAAFRPKLRTIIEGHLARVWIQGDAQLVTWGMTKGGFAIQYEGPPISQAIEYAAKHGAQMITKMDEETKKRIAQIISDGIKNKRGVEGLARDLRKEFEDMSRYRAKIISQTETCDALEDGFMTRAKIMGIEGKEWVVTGDERVCEICLGNEAEGIVPLDHVFSSGHVRPPGHVSCRCALAPARLPSGE